MRENIRILVVDDDESIRRYIVKLLTQGGYDVYAVSSGKDALRELRAGQEYSLIILDILMPDMDGLETLNEVRKISKDMPILMLSALGQTNIIVKAMKAAPRLSGGSPSRGGTRPRHHQVLEKRKRSRDLEPEEALRVDELKASLTTAPNAEGQGPGGPGCRNGRERPHRG